MTLRLGIDLGGSAIKAGVVNIEDGAIVGEVSTRPTPQPSTPAAVASAISALAGDHPGCTGPIGFAFPAVVTSGIARTAANVDHGWIGCNGAELVRTATGRPCGFVNDADAAGLAEMRFGAGRGVRGAVMVLTLGTGIGTALFIDGRLWPNSELGHLEVRGEEAEHRASARVRSLLNLDWTSWAGRVNEVLDVYHRLLWPDLYIISGGVTEHWTEFGAHLAAPSPIVPAALRQHAGVVGAAVYAAEHCGQS
jgi:polyphosphate glucokinase